jgi:hypothetical protein
LKGVGELDASKERERERVETNRQRAALRCGEAFFDIYRLNLL